MKETALLILAAGSSSRMGRPKQLLDIGGDTLIKFVVDQLESDQYDMYVVTGAYRDQVAPSLADCACIEIYNPIWDKGMGISISVAVSRILQYKKYTSVIVIGVDQVRVKSNHILDILNIWKRHQRCIISSQYGKVRGIPALFPMSFFTKLTHLEGDVGARKIINQEREYSIFYNLPEAQWDVDNIDDYKAFIKEILHENN